MSNRNNWFDLLPLVLKGAEGEEEQQQEEDPGTPDPNAENGNQEREEPKDNSGLLSALQAERKRAKEAEKKAKALEREKEQRELSERSELEQVQTKLQAREAQAQKLAAAYLNREINDAIKEAASKLKFIDVTDAINGVDRNALVYEQDDDDPSDISIDLKTVEAAVKKIAVAKPHYLQGGTDDGNPTGSGHGGPRKKPEEDEAAKLRSKYPSLN